MGCLEGYKERVAKCDKSEDDGYSQCSQKKDEGYNSCDGWGFFSFLCDAWVWVSNIVCVAWTWVSHFVCVAWSIVTLFVCTLWIVITTVVIYVVQTIVGVLSPILNFLGLLVQLIFAIPGLGRFLNAIWNIILTIVYGILGIVDAIGWLVGIRPEKHLYLVVMSQKDEKGNFVASDADIVASIALAIQTYKDDANIRVQPFKVFDYTNPFSAGEQASDPDFINHMSSNSAGAMLDVDCGLTDLTNDLGFSGGQFQYAMTLSSFWNNWQRLIGYGAPIFAFSVRSFTGTSTGCSLGPLDDYVLVEFTGSSTDNPSGGSPYYLESALPHEMGHACNLGHVDPSNLMQPSDPRTTNLSWWQILLVRASRHATYFG
jgi:hypothetical protein